MSGQKEKRDALRARVQEHKETRALKQEEFRKRMQEHREAMIRNQRAVHGKLQLRLDARKHLLNNYRMIRKTFYAQFLASLAAYLASTMGPIADGIVIGQYMGSEAVAAYGIINPLFMVFVMAGAMVACGARNRFSHYVGQGQIPEAQGIFTLSYLLSVGLSVVMMAVILPLAGPIAGLLGASGNAAGLLPEAKRYLIGISIGLPGLNAYWVMYDFMMIDNDRSLPIIASGVMSAVNIVADVLVAAVFHGGLFEMGLATSLSSYAGALTYFVHFLRKNRIVRFRIHGMEKKEIGRILRDGVPNVVSRITRMLNTAMLNRLLARIATAAAIAAYSVHRQASSFSTPVADAMADTVVLLAGILMSEQDRPMIQKMFVTYIRATLSITMGVSILGFIAAPWFAGIYINDDPEALRLAVDSVRMMMIGLPLYGLNLIYMNYITGIGKHALASATAITSAALQVLAAWALSGPLGARSIWIAFPAAQLLLMLFYSAVIVVTNRRLKNGPLFSWDALFLLPVTFDVPPEDRMDLSIQDEKEVMDLSAAVWDFCEEHGCDERRKYLMSLSVEEIAGNALQRGSEDGKKHSINARILKKGDDYILRVRDDCAVFDPMETIRTISSPEEDSRHYGLRMIHGMAQEFRHSCILKLNNLFVRM